MSATQLARVAQSAQVQNYSKGAGQSALDRMKIANFVAPVVPVPGTKFEYFAYDSKSPYKIMKTKRGIGGPAAVLDTGGATVTSTLDANAIDAPIDQAEQLAEPTLILTLQERADEAAQAAALAHDYEVVSAALAAAGAGTDYSAAQASSKPNISNGTAAVPWPLIDPWPTNSAPSRALIGPASVVHMDRR